MPSKVTIPKQAFAGKVRRTDLDLAKSDEALDAYRLAPKVAQTVPAFMARRPTQGSWLIQKKVFSGCWLSVRRSARALQLAFCFSIRRFVSVGFPLQPLGCAYRHGL
jgi:hypothetical protein